MTKIIAIVGMPGSGKSEVTKFFVNKGYYHVYFGDVTFEAMEKAGIAKNETNERAMRERIRKEHGMDAYAKLSLPKIKKGLEEAGKVVVESMYSFEEYKFLKSMFGDEFIVVAVYASPRTRYKRLGKRNVRPLTPKECEQRDISQLENLHTGGPIAMADFTIANEGTMSWLKGEVERLLRVI